MTKHQPEMIPALMMAPTDHAVGAIIVPEGTIMNAFAVYTETHRQLLNDFYLPSLPTDLQATTQEITDVRGGTLGDPSWPVVARQRTEWLLETIATHVNEIIIFSDVDVQWFVPTFADKAIELLGDADVVAQHEWDGEACCGFQIIRCSQVTIDFYRELLSELRHATTVLQDQPIFNALIAAGCCQFKLLPDDVVWTTRRPNHMTFDDAADQIAADGEPSLRRFVVPRSILVHHANWVQTMAQKIAIMSKVREIVASYQHQ